MKRLLGYLAVVFVLAWPSVARADTIRVDRLGTFRLTANVDTSASLAYPHLHQQVSLGQIEIDWNGQTHVGYCIEMFSPFDLGDSWSITARRMSDLPTGGPGATANPPYAAAGVGSHAAYIANTFSGRVRSNTDAAALQLALWLTMFPQLQTAWFDFGSADANTTVRTLAWQWYIDGTQPHHVADAIWLDHPTGTVGQDFVVPDDTPSMVPPTPVPEPASLLLLGTGLLGVAGAARRRLRRR